MTAITLNHTNYGPTDHSGGNSLANASALGRASIAEALADAEIGDTISYDEMEKIDDLEAAALRDILRERDMVLIDDGDGHAIGWKYAKDGSLLADADCRFGDQPETAQY